MNSEGTVTNNKPLDYSALSRKVTFSERINHGGGGFKTNIITYTAAIVIAFTSLFMSLILIEYAFFFFFIGIFILIIVIGLYVSAAKHVRLKQFADQNNLVYKESFGYDGRSGLIFQLGESQEFTSVLQATNQAFAEIGNYQYETGEGKNRQTHDYGYVHIKLPRKLPHMVLDAKKNNLFGKFSNLPTGFSGDQKLELEGSFNSYFTLYAPAQYKTDALYVFTPDVMQAMIDAAHDYDCEIIDDSLYLYSPSKLKLTDAKRLQEIVHIASLLSKEFTEQTDYYADSRVGDRSQNIIAAPGKRLATKVPVATIILITLFGLFYVWSLFFSR